jgi:hypothetical protein
VTVTDPAALENSRAVCPRLDYASTAAEAAEGAEAVLVLTEWREYRGDEWARARWSDRAFGRPSQGDPTAPRCP